FAFTGTRRAEEIGSSCRHSRVGARLRPVQVSDQGSARFLRAVALNVADSQNRIRRLKVLPSESIIPPHAPISARVEPTIRYSTRNTGPIQSLPPNRATMTISSHVALCASHFSSHKSY